MNEYGRSLDTTRAAIAALAGDEHISSDQIMEWVGSNNREIQSLALARIRKTAPSLRVDFWRKWIGRAEGKNYAQFNLARQMLLTYFPDTLSGGFVVQAAYSEDITSQMLARKIMDRNAQRVTTAS